MVSKRSHTNKRPVKGLAGYGVISHIMYSRKSTVNISLINNDGKRTPALNNYTSTFSSSTQIKCLMLRNHPFGRYPANPVYLGKVLGPFYREPTLCLNQRRKGTKRKINIQPGEPAGWTNLLMIRVK